MGTLIELNDCIFDQDQLSHSFGYENLDPVGQEAFVNHVHFSGINFQEHSRMLMAAWENEMETKWSNFVFRIYLQQGANENTLRFHRVRQGIPNWYKDEGENIIIKTVGEIE
jgi:hypothetical protein